MTFVNKSSSYAFTLIELLIVILIMGVVYSVVNFSFGKTKKELPPLTLTTLPDVLRQHFTGERRTFIIYGDECENAVFSPPIEENKISKIQFSKDLQVYTFDAYGALRLKEYGTLHVENDDLPVCFKYDIFTNQSTSHMLVKSGDTFYTMPSMFGHVTSFKTMQAAQTALLHSDINPHELYGQR